VPAELSARRRCVGIFRSAPGGSAAMTDVRNIASRFEIASTT